MTKPCITVYPELGVEYLARLFAQSRFRRTPVVQGTKLLGIVSIGDILFKSDFVETPSQLFLEDRVVILVKPLPPQSRGYLRPNIHWVKGFGDDPGNSHGGKATAIAG